MKRWMMPGSKRVACGALACLFGAIACGDEQTTNTATKAVQQNNSETRMTPLEGAQKSPIHNPNVLTLGTDKARDCTDYFELGVDDGGNFSKFIESSLESRIKDKLGRAVDIDVQSVIERRWAGKGEPLYTIKISQQIDGQPVAGAGGIALLNFPKKQKSCMRLLNGQFFVGAAPVLKAPEISQLIQTAKQYAYSHLPETKNREAVHYLALSKKDPGGIAHNVMFKDSLGTDIAGVEMSSRGIVGNYISHELHADIDISDGDQNAPDNRCWRDSTQSSPVYNQDGLCQGDGTNQVCGTNTCDRDSSVCLLVDDLMGLGALNTSQFILDFIDQTYQRDSYDEDGGTLELYYNTGHNNSSAKTCTTKSVINLRYNVDYSVQANRVHHHEFHHTMMQAGYGFTLNGRMSSSTHRPTRAMKEHLADMWAILIFADQQNIAVTDWTLVTRNAAEQRTFSDLNRTDECDDGCGPAYTNARVFNHMFYLFFNDPNQGRIFGDPLTSEQLRDFVYLVSNALDASLLPEERIYGDQIAAFADQAVEQNMISQQNACRIKNAIHTVEFPATFELDLDCDGTVDQIGNDFDGDGIIGNMDNCPSIANADQEDSDGDGFGDVCDGDMDNDGIPNENDVCPRVSNNPATNPNAVGNATDCEDDDRDGIVNVMDNCPTTFNPAQLDLDNDGLGDTCDDDIDGDNILNSQDNCQVNTNRSQRDRDNDGVGDICDNCVNVSNPTQSDLDSDDLGDACDLDRDGDGIPNSLDSCPELPIWLTPFSNASCKLILLERVRNFIVNTPEEIDIRRIPDFDAGCIKCGHFSKPWGELIADVDASNILSAGDRIKVIILIRDKNSGAVISATEKTVSASAPKVQISLKNKGLYAQDPSLGVSIVATSNNKAISGKAIGLKVSMKK